MFDFLKVRLSQGRQYIVDPRTASPQGYAGRLEIADRACAEGCRACVEACAVDALSLAPVKVDLGRCTSCADCVPACPNGLLSMTNVLRNGATTREALIHGAGKAGPTPLAVSAELARQFGRSLKLRSVSTGGCSACELELNALGNVNFDLGRWGIEFVASPRHADALVLSGPLTRNMQEAVDLCWAGMPRPRFVIAFGACAISGGPYAKSEVLSRQFLADNVPALYLPGCPPHPLTFVCAVLDLLGVATG